MTKKIFINPLFILFFLYLMAYGLILINAGVWWDDWCLYNMNVEGIKEIFIGNGGFFMSPIHIFLQNISSNSPLVYRFLTFIIYFLTSVFLYFTLPYLNIEGDLQFVLTAFFTVLPINFARIYMICFPYSLGILFCFAELYFFTVAFYKKQILFRLLALICCILSFFFLASAFVFIPAYIAFIIILNSINLKHSITKNLYSILRQVLKYCDFIIITLLSWVFILVFIRPTGLYATGNYNSISLQAIIKSPIQIILSYIENIVKLTDFANSAPIIMIFIFIFILLLIIFNKKTYISLKNPVINLTYRKKNIKLSLFLILGLYFFIAGAMAYVFVGKSPIFLSFPDSRFQTLMGIGITLSILGILIACLHESYLKYVFILLLSVFITGNIEKCLIFQGLHYRNLAFMQEISRQEIIANNKNFLVIDNIPFRDDNARFYTFQGMAKKIFGDERRFIITKSEYDSIRLSYGDDINVFKKQMYNMKDASFNGFFDYYIIIEEGKSKLTSIRTLIKLMFNEYFNKKEFSQKLDNILKIICLPYQNE